MKRLCSFCLCVKSESETLGWIILFNTNTSLCCHLATVSSHYTCYYTETLHGKEIKDDADVSKVPGYYYIEYY